MAIVKLIPSTYSFSDTHLDITDVENMYSDVSSDTFATVINKQNSTASCYLYIGGFNFSAVPSNAIVRSYTVKLKVAESGVSTSSSYAPRLVGIDSICQPLRSGTRILVFDCKSDWETISSRDFKIEINCRKLSKNNPGFVYVYGAEIEVDYTTSITSAITTSVVGRGSISPNGVRELQNGSADTLTIAPDRTGDKIYITKNGADVSGHLIPHGKTYVLSAVLGNCKITSGSFGASDAVYFTGIVGHGVGATRTISNYRSNSSSTVFEYDMSFSGIPSNATVERVYCKVNGHAENASSSCMSVQLKSDSTYLSKRIDFKTTGTNNNVVTLQAKPTIKQLESMVLECEVGSYGGAINGATCYVEYSINESKPSYYTYTYIVNGNADIAVTIEPVINNSVSVKLNGAWIEASEVYKKVNDVWVRCNDLTAAFDPDMNYVNVNV